jgi:hypothetical protein
VCHGDIDEFAAGKRIADLIRRALATKFHKPARPLPRGARLFEPRVVQTANAPAAP